MPTSDLMERPNHACRLPNREFAPVICTPVCIAGPRFLRDQHASTEHGRAMSVEATASCATQHSVLIR
jgi:hypothetical protein